MRKPDGSGSTDAFVAMIEDKSAGNIFDVLNLVNSRFIKHTGVFHSLPPPLFFPP